jgi:hypothetical protein
MNLWERPTLNYESRRGETTRRPRTRALKGTALDRLRLRRTESAAREVVASIPNGMRGVDMAHGIFCTCKRCCPSFLDSLSGKGGNFNKKRPDGTRLYGTKDRTGFKHGHSGSNFNRTPHSSLGSAALGKPHGSKGHKTHRW